MGGPLGAAADAGRRSSGGRHRHAVAGLPGRLGDSQRARGGLPPFGRAREPGARPLKADFGPGFRLETDDDEYQLQVDVESQVEARAWAQGNQDPAHSGFFLPRQRIFFRGQITKPIEYELSINRGLNNINLLNAYLNFHFDDRFQVRFGRYFTPMNYDQYAISNYWMPTPERSLFTTNVGLSRQIGLDGVGLPPRQSSRLRRRALQRLAQLVQQPQ